MVKTRKNSNDCIRPRISDEMRYKIISLHQDQLGYKKIAEITQIAKSSVRNIIIKYKKNWPSERLAKIRKKKEDNKSY